MKNLSPKEAITILEGMRIDIPVPKAAVTQIKRNLALDMAINAFNCSEFPNNSDTISRQAEQSACEYCHEDSDGYVLSVEKNGHAFVRFGMDGWELSLSAKGWHGGAKIRFCPMCGRKLRGDRDETN